MKIQELLTEKSGPVNIIAGDESVGQALSLMSAAGVSALLVMAGQTPMGIFTERDLIRCHMNFPGKEIKEIQVSQVMTAGLIVAEPGETIEEAMAMMIRGKIRHLPVVEGKRIIGLVSLEDLVKTHVGALTRELHYLKDYISDLQDAAHD
jgi:IMP dehydrogenase